MNIKESLILRDEFEELMEKPLTSDTCKEAINIIFQIGVIDSDDEVAHSMEKDLWKKYIHQKAVEGDPLAWRVLETMNIDFSRWFS